MPAARQKVVVVGAGFGGLNVVHALARAPVDVVLIDRNNHHLFQPLLYQVATAALASSDIAAPIRAIFARQRNVEVLLGEVDGVDVATRTVSMRDVGAIPYDQLVLATGSADKMVRRALHVWTLAALAESQGCLPCSQLRCAGRRRLHPGVMLLSVHTLATSQADSPT